MRRRAHKAPPVSLGLLDARFQKGQDVLKFRPVILICRDKMFVGFEYIARLVVFTFIWTGECRLAVTKRRRGFAGVYGQQAMQPQVTDKLEIAARDSG